jgi:hypothetical protein
LYHKYIILLSNNYYCMFSYSIIIIPSRLLHYLFVHVDGKVFSIYLLIMKTLMTYMDLIKS